MGTERAKADLLPGTLDMLVLRMLMRGYLHGYAIAQLIQQLSDLLRVEEGFLYSALLRALRPDKPVLLLREGDTGGRRAVHELLPGGSVT